MYLLTPLGRGGRCDSSCRGGVGNGGLWWPEWRSEGYELTSQPLLLLLLNLPETVVWSLVEGEVVSGDEGEVGWSKLVLELLTERERERDAGRLVLVREGVD